MPVLWRITTCWLLPRNSTVLPFMAGSAWVRPEAGRGGIGSCSFSGGKATRWSLRRPETPNKPGYLAKTPHGDVLVVHQSLKMGGGGGTLGPRNKQWGCG